MRRHKRFISGGIPRLRKRGGLPFAQRGSVVYLVLVFVLAASVLVLISSLSMRSDVELAHSELARLRAYACCVSGREFLENRLMISTRNEREYTDIMGQPLSPRLLLDATPAAVSLKKWITDKKYLKNIKTLGAEDISWTLELQDSAGLLNAFALTPPLAHNILKAANVQDVNAESLISCLRDWMDPDDLVRPNGAENDFYKKLGYSAANRLVENREQLPRIKGFSRPVYRVLGPLLDFTPENLGMNPNTMPQQAFFIFPGLSEKKISLLLRKRLEQPFFDVAGLSAAAGYNFNPFLSSLQFFTSETTYVKIRAGMDEQHDFFIFLRLTQAVGAGSMRRGQTDSAFGDNAGTPEENFSYYFHTTAFSEGVQEIRHD